MAMIATPDCNEYCIDADLLRLGAPVIDALRSAGLWLVTAESCTAGLIAATLSHVPGAGECLHGGFVVYSKDHKTQALGVDRGLLRAHGSVCEEVAKQMALGALERSAAHIALAVTGVLGPEADADGSPPGLVYFAIGHRDRESMVWKRQFAAQNPHGVRRSVVVEALKMLYRSVQPHSSPESDG
jgi:nicotinamide-nucleotide amidase